MKGLNISRRKVLSFLKWIENKFSKKLDNPHFWYFRYGAQKEDYFWFSDFKSEAEFERYFVESRCGWLCVQFTPKITKHQTLRILKTIPPIGEKMSEKLDNDIIREWWKKISSHAQEAGLKDYQGIHEPIKFPMLGNK